jgi:ribosomal-protein-alanine N-acetyltransferase
VVVSGLKIRAITEADRKTVGLVGFAAWQSSDAFEESYLDPVVIERVRGEFECFAQDADVDIVVADKDGVVVGWGARGEEPDYISDLWVDPNWQGNGIGRQLIEHFIDQMRRANLHLAKISTHAANGAAIRLYERCGFSIVWRGAQWSQSMRVELQKVRLEKLL